MKMPLWSPALAVLRLSCLNVVLLKTGRMRKQKSLSTMTCNTTPKEGTPPLVTRARLRLRPQNQCKTANRSAENGAKPLFCSGKMLIFHHCQKDDENQQFYIFKHKQIMSAFFDTPQIC
jgi:hypothetical protein